MNYDWALESEFELEASALLPAARIYVRQTEAPEGELEAEPFDPSPPAPGTVLLMRFRFGRWDLLPDHKNIVRNFASWLAGRKPVEKLIGELRFAQV